MTLRATNVYQRLVLKQYDLRPPSRLYHLEPIGVGTPYTESLTSYISRLAEAHCLTTGHLFAKELAPAADKKYLFPNSKKNRSSLSTSFYPATPGLVSCGSTAEDWVQVIERLTLRTDLRHLTMLRWRNIFAQGTSSRPNRAWCSACLREQKEGGKIVYEHLLWMQKHVQVCHLHRRPLSTHCPHCGKQLRPLSDRSRAGHCSSCGNWLGTEGRENRQESPNDGLTEKQLVAAEQVGHLIARAPYLPSDPDKESLFSAIWKCVDECAGGYIPGFARHFGINQITVSLWRLRNYIPMFDSLLMITKGLGVSLLDFITDKNLFGRDDVKATTSLIRIKAGRTIVRRKPVDLRQAFLKMLEEDPPPSLDGAARQLGYMSTHSLKKYHPDISQLVTERYEAYIEQEKTKRPETFDDSETVRPSLELAKAH